MSHTVEGASDSSTPVVNVAALCALLAAAGTYVHELCAHVGESVANTSSAMFAAAKSDKEQEAVLLALSLITKFLHRGAVIEHALVGLDGRLREHFVDSNTLAKIRDAERSFAAMVESIISIESEALEDATSPPPSPSSKAN